MELYKHGRLADLLDKGQGFLHDLTKELAKFFSEELGAEENLPAHEIFTEGSPIKQRAYRCSPKEEDYIKTEVQRLLDAKLIQPSTSPWSNPVVLVTKKNGALRG